MDAVDREQLIDLLTKALMMPPFARAPARCRFGPHRSSAHRATTIASPRSTGATTRISPDYGRDCRLERLVNE
jgi:hypothetical protein